MGIPFEEGILMRIVVIEGPDEINSLTGRLGNIKHISVKVSLSKKGDIKL